MNNTEIKINNSSSGSLKRGTAIVGSITLISRLLGFVREVFIATLFGASSIADTFFVAFRIPNLLRSIFAEGALTSAYVPTFTEKLKQGDSQAKEAFCSIASLLLLVTSLLTVIGIIYAENIVALIAPGFQSGQERFELCVKLTRIMLPYIICVSLVSLINGTLNSVKIFGISAFAQVVMNIVLIIGAYVAMYFNQQTASIVLAWSVIVGGITQVLSQLPSLKKVGFPVFFIRNPFTKSSLEICILIIPAIFGAAIYQLTVFINTQIASELEPGSVSWLSYADRLVQLPIGVFTIALSSVLLPTLSKSLVDNNQESFNKNLIDALRFTSFIIIPVSAVLILYGDILVKLIYQRGAFDSYATIQTSLVVAAYSFGLFAISAHSLLIRAIQAKKDTFTPTIIGVFTLFFTLFLSLIFIGTPNNTISDIKISDYSILNLQKIILPYVRRIEFFNEIINLNLGAVGLALSSSIAMLLSMTISMKVLSSRYPTLKWIEFLKTSLQVVIAVLVVSITLDASVPRIFGLFLFGPILFGLLLAIKNKEAQETYLIIRRYLLRVVSKYKS